MKMSAAIVLLVWTHAFAGCSGPAASLVPTAPSSAIQLMVFTDPTSGFSTADVRDASERIVRFTSQELIWPPTDTRFPGYFVYGNRIHAHITCPPSSSCQKQSWSGEVRFATKDGERRAYLTCNCEDGEWVVDVDVVNGQLMITPTRLVVSATPRPSPIDIVAFTDWRTGFSATDVRDVHGQIVRFNTADELIWVTNDARFPEFIVDGNFIGYHHKADKFFQVRFGTEDGERRAYLSWPDRLTIADLWVDERGDLKIAETSVPVPGT